MEDFSTPALTPRTKLTPSEPLVIDKADRPSFSREIVRLLWRYDDPIDVYIIAPRGVQKPPVGIYLYGYPADAHRFLDDGYCQRITSFGCAGVGFECAMSGDRYRNRPMRQWFVSELPEALTATAHDVQLILNYLASRGDLDMSRVGMFGQGSGGTVAVLTAAVDHRIKAIDLLDPWADWKEWMRLSARVPDNERPQLEATNFLRKAGPLDPIRWCGRLRGLPVRVQLLAADMDVPMPCQDQFARSAPPQAIVERYGTLQPFMRATAGNRRFQWLSEQLLGSVTHNLSQPAAANPLKSNGG